MCECYGTYIIANFFLKGSRFCLPQPHACSHRLGRAVLVKGSQGGENRKALRLKLQAIPSEQCLCEKGSRGAWEMRENKLS